MNSLAWNAAMSTPRRDPYVFFAGVNTYVPLIGDDVKITISAGFEHCDKPPRT